MTRNTLYSTQLAKGTGMINETLAILNVYEPGMTKEALCQYVIDSNYLSTSTETRAKDIINRVFYYRFMSVNPSVPLWLRQIRRKGLMVSQMAQLFYIYCARENAVMYDFIATVLNPAKESGQQRFTRQDFTDYMHGIVERGEASWSDFMQKKNGGYLRSTLIDFGLLDEANNILPFDIDDFTVLYLMHELHFSGLSDMAIWEHEDWKLFNLNKYDVLSAIMNKSLKGGYIAQTSGDILSISWSFNSMEEMIDATL